MTMNSMYFLNSQVSAQYLQRVMLTDVEEFWVLALNSQKRGIGISRVFKGTVDSCFFHPRDVFRFACNYNASSIIVAHNHPSQNSKPSLQDIEITKKLMAASELLQIPLEDHLIITEKDYFSFADYGFLHRPR